MAKAIPLTHRRRRIKRVTKLNLRLSLEEAQAIVKLVIGEKLTGEEGRLVSEARNYIDAKIAIRVRGSSPYDDDDEFDNGSLLLIYPMWERLLTMTTTNSIKRFL